MKIKYYDVQAKIIKEWESLKRFMCQADEEYVYFTSNGYIGYVVPKQFFIIDPEKIKERFGFSNSLKQIMNVDSEDEPNAVITGTTISKSGKSFVILKSNECEAYVDPKLFKEFNNANFQFHVKDEKSPIKIFWCGNLYGIICPVKK